MIYVLLAIIVYQGIIGYESKRDLLLFVQEQTDAWQQERQQLLDRIQAPSFAEYKQAEVRVIKASKEEPPTERIELL